MANPLFFIALIPPDPIRSELTGFKQFVADNFASKRALNSPPHITIIPPFRIAVNKINKLLTSLTLLSHELSPFYLTLNGFARFSNKVVYVDVEKNDELIEMHSLLSTQLRDITKSNESQKQFHPHMTIGFRDLDPSNFTKAWKHFQNKDYFRVFEAKDLYLLKHNGSRWLVQNQINIK